MHLERSPAIALIEKGQQRHAHEFAAALAGLHLLKAKMTVPSPLIDEVIARLDNAVLLERHLLACGTPDLYPAALKLCMLFTHTRPEQPRFRLQFSVYPKIPDLGSMRLILRVAYRLIHNALEHLPAERSAIGIRMRIQASAMKLSVSSACEERTADMRSIRKRLHLARVISSELGGDVTLRHRGAHMIAIASFPFLISPRTGKSDSGLQADAKKPDQ